jgi:phosphate starvation-inducible PhoH-like protein
LEATLPKRKQKYSHAHAAPENNVISLNTFYNKKRQIHLLPKSLNQETYINFLTDPAKLIIFATGPAGTGKTMLAMLAGLQALRKGEVNKIVLTRPAVGVDDERHGFLPGTLNQKMEPWTKPLFDVVMEYYDRREVAKMIEEEIIEISPLAYMRGRNLKNSFIICDEMQNATVNQMKMVLTRIAENSKLVVTGDLNQTDRQFTNTNGLLDFIGRLKNQNSSGIGHVHLSAKDIQRHPMVKEVLNIYGEA